MTNVRHYQDEMPSITLDFRQSKYLDPRVKARRATSGTGVVDGVVTTFPVDTARLTDDGLLIEEERTNYVVNSGPDTAFWSSPINGTVSNVNDQAPDGTAGVIRFQTTANSGQARMLVTVGPAGDYVTSLFARSRTGADQDVTIKFSEGGIKVYILPASGEWIRCVSDPRSRTAAQASTFQFEAKLAGADIDIWGPQAELGTFPTSYIPTAGAEVTRAADIVSIEGDDFSSWYSQGTGTLVSNLVSPENSSKTYSSLVNIKSSTAKGSPGISVYTWRGAGDLRDVVGSVTGSEARFRNVVTANTPLKLAITYDASEQSTTYNGNTPESVFISTAVPTMVRMDMGDHYVINDRYSNGYLKRVCYYPTRVSDEALQELTR